MDNNNVEGEHVSQICRFYEKKTVFVTGGTGFLGKLLVEKLLRTTDTATIYLLVRDKKGKNMHERLEELFEDVIFKRLNAERPSFRCRVVPVSGDISNPGLGLNASDRQLLTNRSQIVFHVAATVRFDEKLRLAYDLNVRATSNLIDMCKEMKQLEAVVHVSTAYSNCHLSKIDEIFYDYPIDAATLERTLEKLSEEEIEKCTPKILGNWPNTYAFTKALAESVVRSKCAGLPIGVFRPAIVVSTYKEPIEAWIDNLYGPTGVCVGAASGVLRTLHCNDTCVANIVPGDMCVAALIASAWQVASEEPRTAENVPIYNFVSCCEKPITWNEYIILNHLYNEKYPFSNMIWAPMFTTTSSRLRNIFNRFFLHFVPAVLMDAGLIVRFQKPRLVTMYKKINKFSDVIQYFCTNEWTFTNENVRKLWASMNSCDRQLFFMNVADICWLDYFKSYMKGIRVYLVKDDLGTLSHAKIKKNRFQMLHNVSKYFLLFMACNYLWAKINSIFNWLAIH